MLDQVRYAVVFVFSDPLTAGGVVVGAVVLGASGWFAARRFGWRPIPSVFAGIFLGLVLALTFSRSQPSWALVGTEFCLDWLRQRIEALDTEGHWHAVARGSLREALYKSHRRLAQRVLTETRERDPAAPGLEGEAARLATRRAGATGECNPML